MLILHPAEKRVLFRLRAGMFPADIARDLKISRAAVSQTMKRLRARGVELPSRRRKRPAVTAAAPLVAAGAHPVDIAYALGVSLQRGYQLRDVVRAEAA